MTATTTTTKDKTCKDCESATGRSLWTLWEPNEYDCENESCNAHLCCKCINKHPLYVVVPEDAQPRDMDHAQMKKFCKSCFQTKSHIDFTKTFDVVEGSSSGFIFVFVHGGAGDFAAITPGGVLRITLTIFVRSVSSGTSGAGNSRSNIPFATESTVVCKAFASTCNRRAR